MMTLAPMVIINIMMTVITSNDYDDDDDTNICLCNMIMNSDEMKAPYRLTPTPSPPMFGELGAIIRNYYRAMMAMMGALSPPLMSAFPYGASPPQTWIRAFRFQQLSRLLPFLPQVFHFIFACDSSKCIQISHTTPATSLLLMH